MEGTQYVTIQGNRFVELGSNAIVINKYNLGASVDANEFVWLGDSGVVVLGETDGIDGISNIQQPNMTSVTRNLFHETGIYIKQSSPIVQFLSRSSRFINNAIFNIPRAGMPLL